MTTNINNAWITLGVQHNGADVQRAFGGLSSQVAAPVNGVSVVTECIVYYWQQELYPNGNPIAESIKRKNYILMDLDETINTDEGWKQLALAVLTGFVTNLGMPGIVNPSRETLEDTLILPIDAVDGYPLRRDTREKISLV